MLTHANFLGEVVAVFNWVDIGPTDALLGVLPLFHVLALMANLLLPLVKGSRVVYLETLNTTELLRALNERNITAFAVVPQFFNLIHERIFQEINNAAPSRRKFRRHACPQPRPAQDWHQRWSHPFPQSARHARPQDALPGHGRIALRSSDRAGFSMISASTCCRRWA
jgi:acyl-CoA synthetase (AMP-forming)/AMP-acid ligase II